MPDTAASLAPLGVFTVGNERAAVLDLDLAGASLVLRVVALEDEGHLHDLVGVGGAGLLRSGRAEVSLQLLRGHDRALLHLEAALEGDRDRALYRLHAAGAERTPARDLLGPLVSSRGLGHGQVVEVGERPDGRKFGALLGHVRSSSLLFSHGKCLPLQLGRLGELWKLLIPGGGSQREERRRADAERGRRLLDLVPARLGQHEER